MQAALFEVANLASARLDMSDMLRRIHRVVWELMYAPNFFIALHDSSKDSIRFIYFSDEKDPRIVDP